MVHSVVAATIFIMLVNGRILINEVNYMTPSSNDKNEFIELKSIDEENVGMKDHRLLMIEMCKGEL